MIKQRLEAEATRLRERLAAIEDALNGLRKAEALAAELMGDGDGGEVASPSLRTALRELIASKPDTFTAPQLWEEVRARYPEGHGEVHKASVSAAVKELAEEGEVVLVRKGAGRRAALYAKPEQKEGGESPADTGEGSPQDEDGEAGS